MNLLAIDFGLQNIGLAKSSGTLAEPLFTIKNSNIAIERIVQVCRTHAIKKIVLGITQGKIEPEIKKFARKLKQEIDIPVVFQDETLSSKEATGKLFQARAGKRKHKGPKHAFAAAIILQEYMDKNLETNI